MKQFLLAVSQHAGGSVQQRAGSQAELGPKVGQNPAL